MIQETITRYISFNVHTSYGMNNRIGHVVGSLIIYIFLISPDSLDSLAFINDLG